MGGVNDTKKGNANIGDVKNGVTFTSINGVDLTGTFSAQEKTITSSRSAQTVTPDSGKYLSKVTVNKYPDASGTFNASTTRSTAIDMGATNNYRYVNTNSVSNTNSGTYTPSSSQYNSSAVDMGATNTYRYVNTSVCYSAGRNVCYNGLHITVFSKNQVVGSKTEAPLWTAAYLIVLSTALTVDSTNLIKQSYSDYAGMKAVLYVCSAPPTITFTGNGYYTIYLINGGT